MPAGSTRTSKVILEWEVNGEKFVAESIERVKGGFENAKTAADSLRESLTDLRVESASSELGKQYGILAQDITKADAAAKALADDLFKIGATKSDIAAAAREFEAFRLGQGNAGGGGNGTSQLTQFGSKLRSLPSIPIGDTGTDAIANVIRLLGAIPPALLPVIALLGGVTVGFVLLGKQLEGAREQLTLAIAAQNKFYKDAADLTSKQAQDEIDKLKRLNDLNRTEAENQIKVVQIGAQSTIESFQSIFDVVGFLFGQTAEKGAQTIASGLITKDVTDNLADLKKQYDANNTSIQLLEGGLKDGTFAVNDLNEALKKFNADVVDQTIASVAVIADTQQEVNQIIAEGSQKELDAKKKQLEATQLNAETQLKDLKTLIDSSEKGSDAQLKYQAEFSRQNELYKKATYELGQLGTAAVEAAVKLNDAKEYTKKQEKEIADIVQKYGDETTKEVQDDLQKRADIEKKYQDTLLKISDTLADAAVKALQTLQDKQADLATTFGRNELTAQQKAQQSALEQQIKAHEQEAKAARDHARRLRDIQENAQQEQEDAIASRDFTALFKSRRSTSLAIERENRDFLEQQAEASLERAQKQAADQRQYEFERGQRLQAYNFANQDADRQYKRSLDAAATAALKANIAADKARNQELQAEANKHQTKLNMIQATEVAELQIVSRGASARLAIEQALQDALVAHGRELLASINGSQLGAGASSFGGLGAGPGFGGFGSIVNSGGNRNNSISQVVNLNGTSVTAQQVRGIFNNLLSEYLN